MATDVFNLDALEIEERGTPFLFTFAGEEYSIAPALDLRVLAALKLGDFARAVELLLGPEQWDRILTAGRPVRLEHAQALVTGLTAHIGTTAGKSRASRRSSKRTGTKSRPTSNGSTARTSRT